jgi:hypothetical protein
MSSGKHQGRYSERVSVTQSSWVSGGSGGVARVHGQESETVDGKESWKRAELLMRPDGQFELSERMGGDRGEAWQKAQGAWRSSQGHVNFDVEEQESEGLEGGTAQHGPFRMHQLEDHFQLPLSALTGGEVFKSHLFRIPMICENPPTFLLEQGGEQQG